MKNEYDLLRKDNIPIDLMEMKQELLEFEKRLWGEEIYVKQHLSINFRGEQYSYLISGNNYAIKTKAELDEDYKKFLANEHEENVKTWIDNPDYIPDVTQPRYDENDYEIEPEIITPAVGEAKISVKADVVVIDDAVSVFNNCRDLKAFANLFSKFADVRVLKTSNARRGYVCFGKYGFIAQ